MLVVIEPKLRLTRVLYCVDYWGPCCFLVDYDDVPIIEVVVSERVEEIHVDLGNMMNLNESGKIFPTGGYHLNYR